MNPKRISRPALEDIKVIVKLKLSALWASLMFCYIYGDYFGLYKPGTLQGISRNPADPENLIKYSTFNRLCDL